MSTTLPTPAGQQEQARPERPRPSMMSYLGVVAAAAAAIAYIFWSAEGSTIVYFPLGGSQYLYFQLWAGVMSLLVAIVVFFGWMLRAVWLPVVGGIVFITVTWWAGTAVNFTLAPIWEDFGRAIPILQRLGNPEWSYIFRVWDQWVITVAMAVVATYIGCGIGLLLSMLASPVSSPNKATSQFVKALNSVIRSIPDVGYALLFVAFIGGTAFGLGPLAGILALIMFNIGIVAKLTGESIDAVNKGPIEAADAAGANLTQRNRHAVLPQVLPGYISYSLYVFELNIRASAALGLVGVGGIGYVIGQEWSRFNWERISALMIALVVVVLLVDLLSITIRRRLI